MDLKDELNDLLTEMGACGEAKEWADTWATGGSGKTAWEACTRSDWMIWLLARTTVDQDDPRLRLMACDFAEAVLHLVPAGEDRPRKAIEAARAFVAGTITREEMVAACDAASAAASAAAWDAASAAAWAASRSSACDAAREASWAAWEASWAALYAAREASWAAARVVAWDAQCEIIRRYFPKCPPIQAKYLKTKVA